MRKRKIKYDLNEALININELIKKSKGQKSSCACDDFGSIANYLESWATPYIDDALQELERN